jgi:hypothetical protein
MRQLGAPPNLLLLILTLSSAAILLYSLPVNHGAHPLQQTQLLQQTPFSFASSGHFSKIKVLQAACCQHAQSGENRGPAVSR